MDAPSLSGGQRTILETGNDQQASGEKASDDCADYQFCGITCISLPSLATTAAKIEMLLHGRNNVSAVRQIRELFQLPVPMLYLSAKNDSQQALGIPMEIALRCLVGAEGSHRSVSQIVGWKHAGCTNPPSPTTASSVDTCDYQEMFVLEKETEAMNVDKQPCVHNSNTTNDEDVLLASGLETPALCEGEYRDWGKFAATMEKQWDKPKQLKLIYDKKAYLSAGMYCNKPKAWKSGKFRVVSDKNFKFPLPMRNEGEMLLLTEKNFRLPYDLQYYMELLSGPAASETRSTAPKYKEDSTGLFRVISQNIYVDRKPKRLAPADWPECECKPPTDGSPACGEKCLNRCLFTECLENCPNGDSCTNRAFQKDMQANLKVHQTGSRGFGLVSLQDIKANQFIAEYRGEVISRQTCLHRMRTVYSTNHNHYFLNYATTEVIDASVYGTIARFVNHSCNPNCRIEKWQVEGEVRVGLFANVDLECGTELTYDYRFESFGGAMQPCFCGAANCRGFIGVNKAKNDPMSPRKQSTTLSKANSTKTQFSFRKMWGEWAYEKLEMRFKEAMKERSFFRETRLFLVRNMKTCLVAEKTKKASERSTTRSRSFALPSSQGTSECSLMEVVASESGASRKGLGDHPSSSYSWNPNNPNLKKPSETVLIERQRCMQWVVDDLWTAKAAAYEAADPIASAFDPYMNLRISAETKQERVRELRDQRRAKLESQMKRSSSPSGSSNGMLPKLVMRLGGSKPQEVVKKEKVPFAFQIPKDTDFKGRVLQYTEAFTVFRIKNRIKFDAGSGTFKVGQLTVPSRATSGLNTSDKPKSETQVVLAKVDNVSDDGVVEVVGTESFATSDSAVKRCSAGVDQSTETDMICLWGSTVKGVNVGASVNLGRPLPMQNNESDKMGGVEKTGVAKRRLEESDDTQMNVKRPGVETPKKDEAIAKSNTPAHVMDGSMFYRINQEALPGEEKLVKVLDTYGKLTEKASQPQIDAVRFYESQRRMENEIKENLATVFNANETVTPEECQRQMENQDV